MRMNSYVGPFVSRLNRKEAFGAPEDSQVLLEKNGEKTMLGWALIFLIVALVAAVFGFTGVYAAATSIAQILFFVFLVLFLISLITGFARRRQI